MKNKIRTVYYWWKWRKPRPVFAIKNFTQRGRRGWADSDTWSFDSYLAGVLAQGLEYLANSTMGYPCRGNDPPNSCNSCSCEEAWDSDLRENAKKFKRWHDDTWEKIEENDEQLKELDEALEWLKKWFGHLWS